jgi:Fur family transcriptional regulator, ferric uptake regulator
MTVSFASPTVAAPGVEAATAAVRARGLRLTSARRLLIEALFAADEPVSAARIADGLAGKLPSSDVAAVYRNLELLEGIGLVRHVHLGHGPGLYALADRVESEYLQCERCGELRSVRPSTLDGARGEIRRATGYEPRFAHFPIVGLCADCAR